MTTVSSNIGNSHKRISDKPAKRVTPSAGDAQGELLEFFMDIDTDVLEYSDLDTLETLFDDLEWLHSKGLNEALHFSKASHTPEKIRSRVWYKKNRGRVKKLQMRLKKSKAAQKRKEIMSKSQRTGEKKRKKVKYNTPGHVNEYGFAGYIKENKIGENLKLNSDIKRKRQIRKSLDEMFKPDCYRVVQEFTIGETEALLLETWEHAGDTWRLFKHNGEVWRFTLDKKEIEEFITEED